MKCLFITTQFPYPLDNGGKIGAYNGLCVVSAYCPARVLSFTEENYAVAEGVEYFRGRLSNVHFMQPIVHCIHIRHKFSKLIKALLLGYIIRAPYIASKFVNKHMYEKIDDSFRNDYWDIVFIDYLNMGPYAEYIINRYKDRFGMIILKDHNIESDIVKQEYLNSKGIKRVILFAEWKKTKKYEKRIAQSSDVVYTVCEDNRRALFDYNMNTYTMLPTYESRFKYRRYKGSHIILYIGNLSWRANQIGLTWFIEKVFPIIKRRVDNPKLIIAGSGLIKKGIGIGEGVEYVGYIKDPTKLYDIADAFVIPLFEGSGIRIKALDAFDNEVPVVSTTIGCSTIGAVEGRDIFIRDSVDGFAEAVIQLLINEKLNSEIRISAKEYLMDKYSIESRVEEFRTIMDRFFTNEDLS